MTIEGSKSELLNDFFCFELSKLKFMLFVLICSSESSYSFIVLLCTLDRKLKEFVYFPRGDCNFIDANMFSVYS
jgi:hypothetical protein